LNIGINRQAGAAYTTRTKNKQKLFLKKTVAYDLPSNRRCYYYFGFVFGTRVFGPEPSEPTNVRTNDMGVRFKTRYYNIVTYNVYI